MTRKPFFVTENCTLHVSRLARLKADYVVFESEWRESGEEGEFQHIKHIFVGKVFGKMY